MPRVRRLTAGLLSALGRALFSTAGLLRKCASFELPADLTGVRKEGSNDDGGGVYRRQNAPSPQPHLRFGNSYDSQFSLHDSTNDQVCIMLEVRALLGTQFW